MGVYAREEIVAGNEALFRRLNEAIERGRWPGEDDGSFRCECARRGCAQLLDVSRPQYEGVRAHPRRFIVVPGHEDPSVETVVASTACYFVVEKRGRAGEIAEEKDPRA